MVAAALRWKGHGGTMTLDLEARIREIIRDELARKLDCPLPPAPAPAGEASEAEPIDEHAARRYQQTIDSPKYSVTVHLRERDARSIVSGEPSVHACNTVADALAVMRAGAERAELPQPLLDAAGMVTRSWADLTSQEMYGEMLREGMDGHDFERFDTEVQWLRDALRTFEYAPAPRGHDGAEIDYALVQRVFSALLDVHADDPRDHAASGCTLCRAALDLHAAALPARPATPAATGEQPRAGEAEPYLIRNLGGGDLALWWRPNRCGYTTNVDEAGRYTREEAEAQARSRNTDQAWPESRVLAAASRHVLNDAIGGIGPSRPAKPQQAPDEETP